jgi:predicted transcriptional regulator
MATVGLELLLPSKVRRKLLELFLMNPDDAFYIREIERRVQEDFQAVRRELERLETTGLLVSRREANLKYYQLNHNFALVPELSSIIAKTRLANEGLLTAEPVH